MEDRPGFLAKLKEYESELLNESDANGNPTTKPKDLSGPPSKIDQLRADIGDEVSRAWDRVQAAPNTVSQRLLGFQKSLYGDVKNYLVGEVPDLTEVNGRIQNMREAQDLLNKKIPGPPVKHPAIARTLAAVPRVAGGLAAAGGVYEAGKKPIQ
jgi:hypothetical protein